ncbi:unnamed protein product, partial [marine sediment metagenome]
MLQKVYPRTVEAFIESEWYSKVLTAIRSFHLKEDPLDTLQDILVLLHEKDYLARWDSNRGSFSGWLYMFVNNILRIKYNRSNTKGGHRIEGAYSIDAPFKESDD